MACGSTSLPWKQGRSAAKEGGEGGSRGDDRGDGDRPRRSSRPRTKAAEMAGGDDNAETVTRPARAAAGEPAKA